ncbi:MAG: hypothetical protein HWN66_11665 [Candidatus Helarchaeota archaeon]|nr:hypothetical protein [Candidatus Helarchaeota archaeon]
MLVLKNESIKLESKSTKEMLTEERKVFFDDNISKAYAFLRGYELRFAGNQDHEIAEIIVKVDVKNEHIDGKEVDIKVSLAIRDKKSFSGGLFDDRYEGTVYFTVLGLLQGRIKEMTMKFE